MTPGERTERIITEVLQGIAPAREPDHLVGQVLEAAAAARQRRAWPAVLGERLVHLRNQELGSPAGRAVVAILGVALLALIAAATSILGGAPAPSLVPAERGTFRMLPPMSDDRENPSVTVLTDGRVLIAGGYGPGAGTAELWDPATEAFERVDGQPLRERYGHTGVLLGDGRVLLIGGSTSVEHQEADGSISTTPGPVLDAELFDPAGGTFSAAGTMGHWFQEIGARLEADGTVLVTGLAGDPASTELWTPVAEIWDPASLTFQPGPAPDRDAVAPGVWLTDGRRLLIEERLGQVWDPETDSIVSSGPSRAQHHWVPATLLADGRVLIAGGDGAMAHECGQSAEIWDPATLSWSTTGDLEVPRTGHGAALLRDGRVLIVGNWGARLQRCPGGDSAEIFELK